MTDTTDKILADLPIVQRIALGPIARNPLLAIVMEQAEALRQLADWATSAQRMAVQSEPEAPADDAPPTPITATGRAKGG